MKNKRLDVLRILREEKRVTPLLVAQRLGISSQWAWELLHRLEKQGLARKVGRGLYEYAGD